MISSEPHAAESKSGWRPAAAIACVLVPLLLWFAFLFSPISDRHPGWMMLLPNLWLFPYWIALIVSNALFLASLICLAKRFCGGALIASLGATFVVLGILMLRTGRLEFQGVDLQRPSILFLLAACATAILTAAFMILVRLTREGGSATDEREAS